MGGNEVLHRGAQGEAVGKVADTTWRELGYLDESSNDPGTVILREKRKQMARLCMASGAKVARVPGSSVSWHPAHCLCPIPCLGQCVLGIQIASSLQRLGAVTMEGTRPSQPKGIPVFFPIKAVVSQMGVRRFCLHER